MKNDMPHTTMTFTAVVRRRDREAQVLKRGGVEPTLDAIHAFQEASSAPNTRRGYRTDWTSFTAWCEQRGVNPLPAEPLTVAGYLTYAANLQNAPGEWTYKPGTLSCWLGSINKAHLLAGFGKPGANPQVELTMAGIRRERGTGETRKAPLLLGDLRRTLQAVDLHSWPHGVIGHRDHALLLLGFVGAFRRSELAALNVGDVQPHAEDGLHIRMRQSKTDQDGHGITKGLPFGANPLTCAPCAHARWLRILSAGQEGRPAVMRALHASNTAVHICREPLPEVDAAAPLFRPVMKNGAVKDRHISGNVVNDVLQRRVAAVGLNAPLYGGHSLRAGFVTQAFRAGADHHEVMRQTGHKDIATLEIYSRDHAPLEHNAVTRLGL